MWQVVASSEPNVCTRPKSTTQNYFYALQNNFTMIKTNVWVNYKFTVWIADNGEFSLIDVQ